MCTAKEASTPACGSSQDMVKAVSFDDLAVGSESKLLNIEVEHLQPAKPDKTSGMVVLGAFVAGSLVGIIICAPAFVVVVFGAGLGGLCLRDGKVGDFARKVGGLGGKVILAVVKKTRELNDRFHIADKAKTLAKDTGSRIQKADEKRGFSKNLKARASSLWSHIDEKTRPRRALEEQRPPVETSTVTDGTQLPFGQQIQRTDI